MLDAPRRVRPIPLWRLRLIAFVTQFVLLLGISMWLMSTDEVTAVAALFLGGHALKQVDTSAPDVGLVVRAPADEVSQLAGELERAGVHASFADNGAYASSTIADLHVSARRTHAGTAPLGLAVSVGAHAWRAALAKPTRLVCAIASTSCSLPKV